MEAGRRYPRLPAPAGRFVQHAQLTTTTIYANVVGEEEQSIAARIW